MNLYNKNLFAYCDNNPVGRIDVDGYLWENVLDFWALGVSIKNVIENPTDKGAWVALAADGLATIIPFVPGNRVAYEAAGSISDAARINYNGWHFGDDIRTPTRTGDIPTWTTIRSRYWKNQAFYHPEMYRNNEARMKKCLAPLVESNGQLYSMELHHPNGRNGYAIFDFIPLTPWEHDRQDPFRHFKPR